MQSHHIPNHTVPLLSHTESQPLIQTSNNFYTITHTNILHTKSHRNIPLLSFTKLQSQMYHTPNHSEIHSYSHTQNQTNTHKRTKHQITQKYTLIPTQNPKHTNTLTETLFHVGKIKYILSVTFGAYAFLLRWSKCHPPGYTTRIQVIGRIKSYKDLNEL